MTNFNEAEFGKKLKLLLNDSARQIDDSKLDRLKIARESALARQKVAVPVFGLAWAGAKMGDMNVLSPRYLLPVAALVLGAMSVNIWQQNQSVNEIEEIDASLLSGDLPINAYLDKGFDAWLKRNSPQ